MIAHILSFVLDDIRIFLDREDLLCLMGTSQFHKRCEVYGQGWTVILSPLVHVLHRPSWDRYEFWWPALADSPRFSCGTSVVRLDQELPLNQLMYALIDTRAVLDSSGKPSVGETGGSVSVRVALLRCGQTTGAGSHTNLQRRLDIAIRTNG